MIDRAFNPWATIEAGRHAEPEYHRLWNAVITGGRERLQFRQNEFAYVDAAAFSKCGKAARLFTGNDSEPRCRS